MKPTWDEYFMAMALLASSRSHDPETRHGAIVVNPRQHVIGTGYNGYPKGGQDHLYPDTRPDKYDWMIHAEPNALVNCEGPTVGATLYVTGCPCPNCMGLIINAGIRRVVVGTVESFMVDEAAKHAVHRMAQDCRIIIDVLTSDIGAIVAKALLAKGR